LSWNFLSHSQLLGKNSTRNRQNKNKNVKGTENGMQSIMMMQAWASKVRAGKGSKGDRLGIVDHSTITYPPFRKNFYIEVCCHLNHASGYHPTAFGTLCALQGRKALREAGAVLLVSHPLCQAFRQVSFASHICLSI
jgi:hypothetical protein